MMVVDHEDGQSRRETPPPAYREDESAHCVYEPAQGLQDLPTNNSVPTQDDLDRCADLLVLDSKGQSRPFKDLHSGPGVAKRQLIIFVRHFFCGSCQDFLRELASSIHPEELLALPEATFIAVVGCGRPDLIEWYAQTTGCQFPIYADPTRKIYDALGMTRTLELGEKPEYIQKSPAIATAQSIVQILSSGSRGLKGGDFKQVGGEFLFTGDQVTWCHRMRTTRDHAEVRELREILGLKAEPVPPPKKKLSSVMKRSSRSNTVTSKEEDKNESPKGSSGSQEVRE